MTGQAIFFTDDKSFTSKDSDSVEDDLCHVTDGPPVRGAVWLDNDESWEVEGDFRVFAVGVVGDRTFSVGSKMSDAIELRYLYSNLSVPPSVEAIIATLRKRDGSEAEF